MSLCGNVETVAVEVISMGKWLGQVFCCSLLGQRENDFVDDGEGGRVKVSITTL